MGVVSRMNIFLTFPDINRRGGVERVAAECCNYLAGRQHDAYAVAASIDDNVLDSRVHQMLVPIPSYARHPILRLSAYHSRASALLHQELYKPGTVHASFGVTSPPEGILWVQSVHAEWIKIARSHRDWRGKIRQRLNLFHPFILRYERNYYRGPMYRRLIALTSRIKSELIEHYDVPGRDIDVLPNGYNPVEFSVNRRELEREKVRVELGYRPQDRVLIFVANELERKGFFPLVRALASLHEPDIKLLIVGRVNAADAAAELEKLELSSQVYFAGPSADVGRYYCAADYFVLPTYYEAWGLVIVEALASGLPVLTSKLAGAAIVVKENQTGILLDDPRDDCEIADKLRRMLTHSFAAPAAVSLSVEEYRWDRVLSQYEQILIKYAN